MATSSKQSSVANATAPKAQAAHFASEPETTFERARVSQLEGHTISLVCPVEGEYSGTLSLKLAMDSVRSTDGSPLRYAVSLNNPKVPAKRWLTEAGMKALEAKIAEEPLVVPSPQQRRAIAKARRQAMALASA